MSNDFEKPIDLAGIKPGDVRWAHAVNSVEQLDNALGNGNADFIEVDVSVSASNIPIAAHPPATNSDLTIAYLLERMHRETIGLKLDFKDPSSVVPVLEELVTSPLLQPVFLNADVLSADGAGAAKIEGKWFIEVCNEYESGVLSLGWRTNSMADCKYTHENVMEMIKLCVGIERITFPVRATMLPKSWSNISKLIEGTGRTLTIWNTGPLDTELKNWIKANTDPSKCYYDVDLA